MKSHPVLSVLATVVISALTLVAFNLHAEDAAAPAADTAVAAEASTAVLDNETARASYAVGLQMGESLKRSGLALDTAALFAAIEDTLKGRTPALTPEEIKTAMEALQQQMMKEMESKGQKNLDVANEFLAKNSKEEGVVQLESGLQYKVVKPGEGEKPKAESKVRVHYRGTLLDGTQFDSSYDRGEPAEFKVNQVIPGWTEALQLMQVGAQYKLFIPPNLAYGAQGNQRIPGNSLLLFDVELIAIVE
jgi:FKBP-type peptidyl-prolyl cis-trans isomerase